MITRLILTSRYRFVTTKEQLTTFLSLIEDASSSLEGLLVIVDSSLVTGKAAVLLSKIVMQFRKLGLTLVFVTNLESSLDKRLQLNLTHETRMVSKEIRKKEIVH